MLSCSCDAWDLIDCDWYYEYPEDFEVLQASRRKRCCSCKKLIDVGADCVKFERFRSPANDIEERIWGDSVQMADWHMCEDCGGIFLNLQSLGYCLTLGHNVRDDLQDYWDITGFEPNKKKSTPID